MHKLYKRCHGNAVKGFSALWGNVNVYICVCVCARACARMYKLLQTVVMVTLLRNFLPYRMCVLRINYITVAMATLLRFL
jgi:hypothetical protein